MSAKKNLKAKSRQKQEHQDQDDSSCHFKIKSWSPSHFIFLFSYEGRQINRKNSKIPTILKNDIPISPKMMMVYISIHEMIIIFMIMIVFLESHAKTNQNLIPFPFLFAFHFFSCLVELHSFTLKWWGKGIEKNKLRKIEALALI